MEHGLNVNDTRAISAVAGGVRGLLRAEGLCILVISLLMYTRFGSSWGIFVLTFFVPDLSFLGYLVGPKIGALLYNVAHSIICPLLVLAAGVFLSTPAAIVASIVWAAHVGFDRALGFGLKYSAGFNFTHLGRIGRARGTTARPYRG